MARKILVDSSNTVAVWSQKTNTLSDYIGDLDNLDNTFAPGNTWAVGYPNVDRDSSAVSAINYIEDYADAIYSSLVGGTSTSRQTVRAKILADSADFDLLHTNQLWNYDGAMTYGPSDSTWYGDSPGTNKFDFTADSSEFRNLNVVRLRHTPDSAIIGRLIVGDSGFIGTITTADSTSELIIKNLKYKGNSAALIDSALVLNKITVEHFQSDSGGDSGVNIDVARITYLDIDSSITFADSSSLNFNVARPFYVTDSMGIITLNDSSVTYFAAYQLIDSN